MRRGAVFYTVCLMLAFAVLALGASQSWSRDTLEILTLAALLGWAARAAVARKPVWFARRWICRWRWGAAYVAARYAVSPVEWIRARRCCWC